MFSALISLVLRLVLAVATAVLVLGLMALALATLLGLSLWSLIRGRKPVVDLSGFARARAFRAGQGFAGAAGPGGRRVDPADVVDVEAREVGGDVGGDANAAPGRPALPPQAP
ncbi:hypothetical protein QRD43_19865 [Pelomonas sp. APW6]|uniref:Uncharacterized protein n=1 Tax=Roseateles subflavus TaxID=3053353 RepID=A0ABT7LPK5_9BURK|nr:hypothetical protein [Pelomonas sp. APW6]MDL5034167.1 hypothetical protein [Pelomonas sp. APW6]